MLELSSSLTSKSIERTEYGVIKNLIKSIAFKTEIQHI